MEYSKSHIAIVQAAKSLFWKHGMRRVTVEEICKSADVSKMTYYRNFKNKTAVAKEVISQLAEEGNAKFKVIMAKTISFKEKMVEAIALKHEQSKNISEEFIIDILETNNPELMLLMQQMREENYALFQNYLTDAQQKGAINSSLSIPFIMHMLNDLNTKLTDKNLLALYNSKHELIMELTNFFFFGILNQEQKHEN